MTQVKGAEVILQPGEIIVWSGQPNRKTKRLGMLMPALLGWIMLIPGFALVPVLVSIASDSRLDSPGQAICIGADLLILLPFVGLGIWAISYPSRLRKTQEQTHYIVTNQRALTIVQTKKKRTEDICVFDKPRKVTHLHGYDGVGTIVFDYVPQQYAENLKVCSPVSRKLLNTLVFWDVDDVATVSELIETQISNNVSAQRIESPMNKAADIGLEESIRRMNKAIGLGALGVIGSVMIAFTLAINGMNNYHTQVPVKAQSPAKAQRSETPKSHKPTHPTHHHGHASADQHHIRQHR